MMRDADFCRIIMVLCEIMVTQCANRALHMVGGTNANCVSRWLCHQMLTFFMYLFRRMSRNSPLPPLRKQIGLVVMICTSTWEAFVFNLVHYMSYPDRGVLWHFSVPSGECQNSTSTRP